MINGELQFLDWISKTNRKNKLLRRGYSPEEARKIHLLVNYHEVNICVTCGFNPSTLKKNICLCSNNFHESEEEDEENEEGRLLYLLI